MALYLEAPFSLNESFKEYIEHRQKLFLAGGITGVNDWQSNVSMELGAGDDKKFPNLVIFNPRRHNYTNDIERIREQIAWEARHLRMSDAILFWFSYETIQPITLFELGRWSMVNKPIFLGVHPGYERKLDIELQMKLVRPNMVIHQNINSLVEEVKDWSKYESDRHRWSYQQLENAPF